jgi:small subunit ribosomal protein S21
MAKVALKHKNESFDSLMKRFKRAVERSGILKDLREYEYYEPPSQRRKKERAAAIKRQQRITQEENMIRQGIRAPQVKKENAKKRWDNDDQDSRF